MALFGSAASAAAKSASLVYAWMTAVRSACADRVAIESSSVMKTCRSRAVSIGVESNNLAVHDRKKQARFRTGAGGARARLLCDRGGARLRARVAHQGGCEP